MNLPAADIAVVHRSDGSGTTFNFTHYLSQVSPTWKGGPGEGSSVNWPVGVGGKGNERRRGYVKQIPNSVGYVEYAYVAQNGMNSAAVQNSGRQLRLPRAPQVSPAQPISADWKNAKDFNW